MIKLNGHFLNDMAAIEALKKLYNSTHLPSGSAYAVGRIYDKVMRELRVTGEKAIAVHKKYCLLDPTGMPSGLSQGKLEFKEPKDQNEKDHDSEFEALLGVDFEVKATQIPLSHLDGCGLSPREIQALHPLLVLPEEP